MLRIDSWIYEMVLVECCGAKTKGWENEFLVKRKARNNVKNNLHSTNKSRTLHTMVGVELNII